MSELLSGDATERVAILMAPALRKACDDLAKSRGLNLSAFVRIVLAEEVGRSRVNG